MTSVTSILTRITGNGLIVGTLLAVWWLLAAATSDDYFAVADAVATSWFGDLVFTALGDLVSLPGRAAASGVRRRTRPGYSHGGKAGLGLHHPGSVLTAVTILLVQ